MNTDIEEHRREHRHIYHHRLSITLDRHFVRGAVIDWSLHGIQVVSGSNVNGIVRRQIRFHVEKDRGLTSIPELWSREGTVRWVRHQEDGWHIGIQLDKSLYDHPVDEVETYITHEDFCYLFFFPKEETQPV